MIINDSGNASLRHASLIHEKNLGYVCAIKSNCGDIHAEAERLLSHLDEEQAEQTLRVCYRGQDATLRVWRENIQGYLRWTHARQVVRVQRVVEKNGVVKSEGSRFYVTNLVQGNFNGRE